MSIHDISPYTPKTRIHLLREKGSLKESSKSLNYLLPYFCTNFKICNNAVDRTSSVNCTHVNDSIICHKKTRTKSYKFNYQNAGKKKGKKKNISIASKGYDLKHCQDIDCLTLHIFKVQRS